MMNSYYIPSNEIDSGNHILFITEKLEEWISTGDAPWSKEIVEKDYRGILLSETETVICGKIFTTPVFRYIKCNDRFLRCSVKRHIEFDKQSFDKYIVEDPQDLRIRRGSDLD